MKRIVLTAIVVAISTFSIAQTCTMDDLFWMGANPELTQTAATDCGTDCLFSADPDACMIDCMGGQTELTDDCIGCFSGQVDCIVANCFSACVFGIGDCAACATANCLIPFNECAGIEDLDGDTWTNLSDCNDNDASIHPEAVEIWYDGVDQNCDGLSDYDQDGDGEDAFAFGGIDCNDIDPLIIEGVQVWYIDVDGDGYGTAESAQMGCVAPPMGVAADGDCDDSNGDVHPGATGTSEGIDNDCNGVIEGDENSCIADFNSDLSVNTEDLLSLLTEFGCISSCSHDLNGDDAVNTSDMLAFLVEFGNNCAD